MTATATRLERLHTRTEPPPAFRLRGRAHKAVLTAHILSSVGWFGIAIVVAFCGVAAAVTGDSSLARSMYRMMETAPWLSIPIGLVAAATGVILSLGTAYGLVRHWWVVAKIAITVAVIVTDALVVRQVAHHAVVTGAIDHGLYGSTIAHVVMLGVATVVSVFKPRGRTPWPRRSRPAPA